LPSNLTPHSMRHGFASLLIAGGFSIKEVSQWCRHASTSVTLSVYAHLEAEAEDDAPDAARPGGDTVTSAAWRNAGGMQACGRVALHPETSRSLASAQVTNDVQSAPGKIRTCDTRFRRLTEAAFWRCRVGHFRWSEIVSGCRRCTLSGPLVCHRRATQSSLGSERVQTPDLLIANACGCRDSWFLRVAEVASCEAGGARFCHGGTRGARDLVRPFPIAVGSVNATMESPGWQAGAMGLDVHSRWPLAGRPRRLPLSPRAGKTPDATKVLHDLMYLQELSRQAAIFNRSFWDAMTAALVTNDLDECWRHLQSALFVGIVVNRLVDPGPAREWKGVWDRPTATAHAAARGKRLREHIGLEGPEESLSPIYAVRAVRDAMEHLDERLDRIAQSGKSTSVSDWYISDGLILVSGDAEGEGHPPAGLRAFVATLGRLFFNDTSIDMFRLDLDMLVMRHNVAEAVSELQVLLEGRLEYGGPQLREVLSPSAKTPLEALERWEEERATHEALLSGDVGQGEPPNP